MAPPNADRAAPRIVRAALALGPFLVAVLVRLAWFGRPAPLAVYAKPSDLPHGAGYALACLLLTGPVALIAWRGVPGWVRGIQLATAAHLGALVLAGGDWMVLLRLMVPVLPGVLVAAAWLASSAPLVPALLRPALALAAQIYVFVSGGPAAAGVWPTRAALIDELRPAFAGAHAIAALDIGWVGAATDAPIVDLAGITDPAVAALEGGHTSKRVGLPLLHSRGVDALVLLLEPGATVADPWTESRFARWVEAWVATHPGMARDFAPVAVSSGKLRYLVVRSAPKR
jgi:hypothetical protein